MKNIESLFTKHYRVPLIHRLDRSRKHFSPTEKLLFALCVLLLIIGAGSLLYKVNALFLTEIPAAGGELREGIIGSPRFVNPLLSLSNADRDLTTLVYSGLLRPTLDGRLVPDLAEGFKISEDGMSYTFRLRNDATFHDGKSVTADDVVFTIQKAQDPALKSPKRANWEGVSVEKKDDRTIVLTLKQPYAPFLENTTLGILPKHLWKDAGSEQFPFSPFNLDAVGSGPYTVAKMTRNASGIPLSFELSAFKDYAQGAPYIKRIFVYFYQSEKDLLAALARGEIGSVNTVTPQAAKGLEAQGFRIERTPLPRVFGVFFNQNQASVLAEKAVRQALALATDKKAVVDMVLFGYGVPIDSPIPPLILRQDSVEVTVAAERIAQANALLDKAKWVKNATTGMRERTKGKGKDAQTETLSFTLATGDVPELRESAELLKDMWRNIGVDVRVAVFESGDLNQNIIRPRKFDALLFGEIIGRDLDLFAFWHSSQRNDPGLNIAMYTNSKVDKWLEEARKTTDEERRIANYTSAIATITADAPAIFLYSPEFIYVLPKALKGFTLNRTTIPSERFLDVEHWYMNTEKVWNIFAKK
ncbi:MAG: peptide ABC transporter substrate-binding protein [Patescibacteria group bacterium]